MALMTLLAVSGDGMTSCARQMRPGCSGASTRPRKRKASEMEPLRPSPRPVAFSLTIAMRRVARCSPGWGDSRSQGRASDAAGMAGQSEADESAGGLLALRREACTCWNAGDPHAAHSVGMACEKGMRRI